MNQANKFNRLPSEIACISDEYTAFCFNEACFYIITQLENGKKPTWQEDRVSKKDIRKSNLLLAEKLRKKGGN